MPSNKDQQVGRRIHHRIRWDQQLIHTNLGAPNVASIFARHVFGQVDPVVRNGTLGIDPGVKQSTCDWGPSYSCYFHVHYPLIICYIAIEHGPVEMVDLPS